MELFGKHLSKVRRRLVLNIKEIKPTHTHIYAKEWRL